MLDFPGARMYQARPMVNSGKLSIGRYYAIEGLSSFAVSIFQQGIFFWAAARHGFNATQCLLLGATQGLAYVVFAKFGGAVSSRLGYDRIIQLTMIGTAATNLLLWHLGWRWIPYCIMGLFIAFTGPFWPSAEASVLHARSRLSAPQRLGLYNVTWATLGAFGFFACGFIVSRNLDAVVWLPGIVMASQLLFYIFRVRMNAPAVEAVVAHDGNASLDAATKRKFMHLHWLANSLAYFLVSGFSAILPQLGEKLGLTASAMIWLTCSYVFIRAFSFVVLMKWEGWHYRTGWSLASIWVSLACAAVMFFASQPALVLAACIVFGFALALTYSGSLYYSMNYGDNKGEHGGLHEAILGSGILFGPLVGAGGAHLHGLAGAGAAIVATAAVLATIGIIAINRMNRVRG
jgi:MFS family permease